MEYIHGRSQAVFSVEESCRESACSISTLERAFRDHFGASPKQYLTVSRLNGVRHSLSGPAEARRIGDIASAWGFWHMSKFAADYKRMFGEPPSATRAVNVKISFVITTIYIFFICISPQGKVGYNNYR